jgi:hypothetical protein
MPINKGSIPFLLTSQQKTKESSIMGDNPWSIGHSIQLDADSLEWLLDGNEDSDLFNNPGPLTKVSSNHWELTEGNNSIVFKEQHYKILKILIENAGSLSELDYIKETYDSRIVSNDYNDLVEKAELRFS